MTFRALFAALGAAVLSAVAAPACGDPVHDDAVAALGDEAPGVPPGQFHRPGQPCLVCHGGSGPGSPTFAFAGTVYSYKGGSSPLVNAQVVITDASGASRNVETNTAGNFYIAASDWTPVFPATPTVSYRLVKAAMDTHIGRDGSCASCHVAPPSPTSPGPTSPGPVYVFVDQADAP